MDLTTGDWAAALESHLDCTAAAWKEPTAWEGITQMDGMELPASLVGGMLVGELVVHGWDIARASGQEPVWEDELLTYLHAQVAATAAQGREMGVYGPEVPVPDSASILDRILGLTGRDPSWTT